MHFLCTVKFLVLSLATASLAAPVAKHNTIETREVLPRLGLDIISDLLKGGPNEDLNAANGGPVGPGLSKLVAIAEAILKKYGITKTYGDLADLDVEPLAIIKGILSANGKRVS